MMNCRKKLEELKEENKLLRKDMKERKEWLNRESNMKDKLLSEKVSLLNNLIQKVNTTTTPVESNYQPATRSLSKENLHQETDNCHIIHLIGGFIIKAVNPELLLPYDVKTEMKKTHCYVLEKLKDFTPDPQAKLIIIHCGTNNISKCNNVDDALALIQENLIALKENYHNQPS